MTDLYHEQMKTIRAIDRDHQDILLELTGDATVEERDTWQMKVEAASEFSKYFKENPSHTVNDLMQAIGAEEQAGTFGDIRKIKMIVVEASISEIPPEALAQGVLEKSFAFQYISAVAAGMRTKGKKAVLATTSIDELNQVRVLIEQTRDATIEQVKSNG